MSPVDDSGSSRARSPSLLVFGRLGASALALVSAPIVARAIGPDGRGETAAAIALFLIVPVLIGVGLPLEVRRQAATTDGHAVLRSAKILVAIAVLPAAGLAGLAWFTLFSEFDPFARLVASIGITMAPLAVSWAMDVSVLVAHRRYRAVFAMQLTQPSVYLVLLLGFWASGHATVATVLIANLGGMVGSFVLGIVLVPFPIIGPRAPMVPLVRSGLKFFGSSIAEIASNRIDQVIALPLIGPAAAGIYSVAATIGAVPLAIGQALGASYFQPIAQADGAARRRRQAEATRVAVAAALIGTPVVALLAWPLIPVVFGELFAPAVPVTMIVLVGSAAMLAAYVVSMALAADGRGIRMTVAQVVSLAVGVAALFAFGPWLGAFGAAIASTIAFLVLLTVLIIGLGLPLREVVPRPRDFLRAMKRLLRD